MSLLILKPGILASLQDEGRKGYQRWGIPLSGAMDDFASQVANLLVGNQKNIACIEFTLGGVKLFVEKETLISCCGKGIELYAGQELLPMWKSLWVQANTELRLESVARGCRVYLALAGGFDLPPLFQSLSTYEPAMMGGFQGRALAAQDRIPLRADLSITSENMIRSLRSTTKKISAAHWGITLKHAPDYGQPFIRAMAGPEWSWFRKESQQELFSAGYLVSSQSGRMGYRLLGPVLQRNLPREMISATVTKATLQVANDGNMILLMSDAQTTGGYPRIAQVAAVDLPICAQLRPGDSIQFKEISMAQAEKLFLDREQELEQVMHNIQMQFS